MRCCTDGIAFNRSGHKGVLLHGKLRASGSSIFLKAK
jgi:hypothetical protein